MYVQLTWEDPETGQLNQPLLAAPIAMGRSVDQMPEQLGDRPVTRLEFDNQQISRFHALITVVDSQLYVTDQSANGTFLNGRPIRRGSQPLSSKDTLRIGPYKITANLVGEKDVNATELTARNQTSVNPSRPLPQNPMAIWAIGIGILVLMGVGGWLTVSMLLERSRPQPLEEQTSGIENGASDFRF
jgi:pSer/pThr/pTyr-binding forkhead associated (FHA) protein